MIDDWNESPNLLRKQEIPLHTKCGAQWSSPFNAAVMPQKMYLAEVLGRGHVRYAPERQSIMKVQGSEGNSLFIHMLYEGKPYTI